MPRRKPWLSLVVAVAVCLASEVPIIAAQGSYVRERVVFSFDMIDGRNPSAALIADDAGRLKWKNPMAQVHGRLETSPGERLRGSFDTCLFFL
jgi:hypothetical protein